MATFSKFFTLFGRAGTAWRGVATPWARRVRSRLAVDGLPDEFTPLETGCLYAVHVNASAALDALLFNTAQNSRAKAVTVLLKRDAGVVVDALRERGFAAQGKSTWPRRLSVLVSPPVERASAEDAAAIPAFARLIGGLRSLKRFGLKAGSLYIVESANDWFSWHSAATLAQEAAYLANWCKARRCAMVLLMNYRQRVAGLAGQAVDGSDQFNLDAEDGASLRGFHSAFSGAAYLSQSLGEMVWLVKFWRAGGSMITAQSRALRFTPEGALAVAFAMREVGDSKLLTRDETRVLATRAALEGETWVPPEWEVVADNDSMLEACRQVRGATILLDHSSVDGLDVLCRVVHGLRSHCGRAVKIVVRERGASMRHQDELLVLNLGATMVVSHEASFARFQGMMASVQGQLSARPIIEDYRTALSASLGSSVRGYLPLALFCNQVELVIERAQVLLLPHVLLRMKLRADVSHLEALRACTLRRAGDICSVRDDNLYLFLFACPIANSDVALQRIFNGRIGFYFQNIVRYQEFAEQITQLGEDNQRNQAPDYTEMLHTPPGDGDLEKMIPLEGGPGCVHEPAAVLPLAAPRLVAGPRESRSVVAASVAAVQPDEASRARRRTAEAFTMPLLPSSVVKP
jgi:cellulose biosynthesis protein BcsE